MSSSGRTNCEISIKVLAGRPAERILATEKELTPDITVVGTHGRTGLTRVLLGSVAERVVRHAGRPVLTVPLAARARRG